MIRLFLAILALSLLTGCSGQSRSECKKAFDHQTQLTREVIVQTQVAVGKTQDQANAAADIAIKNLRREEWIKNCTASEDWDLACMQAAKDYAGFADCRAH